MKLELLLVEPRRLAMVPVAWLLSMLASTLSGGALSTVMVTVSVLLLPPASVTVSSNARSVSVDTLGALKVGLAMLESLRIMA